MKKRSDAHAWLWQKLKPLINGNAIEIIHEADGEWGFKEYLKTKNVNKYIHYNKKTYFDTIIFHLLLSNNVDLPTFTETLEIAAQNSKRIVIMEHDRDSNNFGMLANPNIPDVRSLLKIIRNAKGFEFAQLNLSFAGASSEVDQKVHGNFPTSHRNLIVCIDL